MTRARSGKGFSLVEVVISLGLIGFVLVALMGLLSTGLKGTQASEDSIEVSNLATVLVDKWNTGSTNLLADIPGSDAASAPAGPLQATAFQTGFVDAAGRSASVQPRFRATYATWRDPSLPNLVRLHLILSAPPQAAMGNASTRYELQTSLNLP